MPSGWRALSLPSSLLAPQPPLAHLPRLLSPLLQPPLPPQTHCYRARALHTAKRTFSSLLRPPLPAQPRALSLLPPSLPAPQPKSGRCTWTRKQAASLAPLPRLLSPLLQLPLPPQTHCYRARGVHTAKRTLSSLLRPPLPAQPRALSLLPPFFLAPQPKRGRCTRTRNQAASGGIMPPPTNRCTRYHPRGVSFLILSRAAAGSSTWLLVQRTCSIEPLLQTHCYRACAVHTYALQLEYYAVLHSIHSQPTLLSYSAFASSTGDSADYFASTFFPPLALLQSMLAS